MEPLPHAIRRFLADEPYRRLTPDELWSRIRDHCEEGAFRVLLDRVGDRIFARCRVIVGDDPTADEAFQEAFAELVRWRAKLPTYAAAVAWLYTTATNKARKHRRWWRRLWHRDRAKAEATPVAVEPAGGPADREQAEAVSAALVALPERERRAVELVYLEGLTHDEAAAALGWPRGAVGVYVGRGLARLRVRLAGKELAAVAGTVGVAGTLSADDLGRLSAGAWARAESVSGWSAGKVAAVAGLVAGVGAVGVAVWPRPADPPPVVAGEAAERETLQAQNLRVLHAEVLPRVVAELDRVLPESAPWAAVHAVAAGSEARVEFRAGRAAGGEPRRIRMSYCVKMRRFWAGHFDPADGSWPTGDPEQPATVRVPLPGSAGELRVPYVHPNRWGEVVRAFDRLPHDDRAERELVRDLFGDAGARGDEFALTGLHGVAANSRHLFLTTGNGGTYVRPVGPGPWRYWGVTLGWGLAVDEERLLCYRDFAVWEYRIAAPAAPPRRVCDTPENIWVRSLTAADGVLVAAPMYDERQEVWVRRAGAWARVPAPGRVRAVALDGADVVAACGGQLLRRPVDRPDAPWTPAGATPGPTEQLFVMGGRLFHVPVGQGPVHARPLAGPQVAWEVVGHTRGKDATLTSAPD